MKKISEEQLNYWIEDESKATKEYKAVGLNNLSKDEARHHKYLLSLRKRWYGY